ncbi:sulfatase-like hydrolase/transferase [Paenibacillus sp. IB182496]|uniref:Sulfatase-like hydrolase/transferase n=1 Tax=Paenibacillus sabuli TaxID=2772509 RepID=A0A927BT73_9BACL|nr:sulfatase-like hydrolase/transferase [Paenibacillus sabuli]MBD2845451.1 sulfatase-like hydrolase/transferase [Paenibacillus sabuli]
MSTKLRKPSNVIVFFTDQQRWDTTGIHGNPLGLTPNFDRMAQEGTHLYHTYTCQPVCGPARSCLQTGKYATTTGCYRNGIPLPQYTKTLAHYYKEHGYKTGYIGKWHLSGQEPVPTEERGGYEYWLASNVLEFSSDAYETQLYNEDCEPVKLPGYRVDALTDAAIRFIYRHQEQPFFMFLSYLEPHHQNHTDNYPAPHGYESRYLDGWTPPDLKKLGGTAPQHLPGYYGMVKRVDEALGRLMDALKSLDMLEDTIILFTSDHGNHFKTRNDEYKRSAHDASIRIPTALYGPGFMQGGQIRSLVSLLDLPPTLLDAVGIDVPSEMQGRSILPLVKRASAQWPSEVFLQISETQVGRAIRTDRWKYSVVAANKNGLDDSCSDRYKEDLLYDLHADPYELTNLAGMETYRSVADSLRKRLIARMVEAGEQPPIIEPAEQVPAKQRRVSVTELRVK